MKQILTFCFCSCIYFCSYSQNVKETIGSAIKKDTIFFDESNSKIDVKSYDLKLESPLFAGLRFDTDSLIIYKLRFSHLFGKLENTKRQQLFKLIASRNLVDTTKIMIFHYLDTLKRKDEFPKRTGTFFNEDSTKHWHTINYRTFIQEHKACIKKLRKRNVSDVYHFYNHNNGHPEKTRNITWHKDHLHLINELFRDSYSRFRTIVIHPNGEFFCLNYNDGNNKIYEDIIKGKRWNEHKNEFIRKLNTLNSLE